MIKDLFLKDNYSLWCLQLLLLVPIEPSSDEIVEKLTYEERVEKIFREDSKSST